MGVNVTRTKVLAFVVSSFLAGVAGGVFAHQSGVNLNAGELNFVKSFDILIMVVLGGLGSISGATLAAIILTILPEMLRDPPHAWPYALGVLVFACAATVLRRDLRPERKRATLIHLATAAAAATAVLELARSVALANEIDLANYRMVIYALALILMMILRPQGLFGVHEVWDLAAAFRRRRA
jgi:branched-chain amino acid transport system permease protein